MLVESTAIFALLLCVTIIFLRSGYRHAALGVMPLLLLPAVHLIVYPIFVWIEHWSGIYRQVFLAFADIASLLTAGILIHRFGSRIARSNMRKLYMLLVSGYNIIVAFVFVFRLLSAIL